MNSLVWMCQRGSLTSRASRSTSVFTVRHLGTSPTISSQPMTSLFGFICFPQTDTSSSYLAAESTHTAVGRFWSLDQRSGTRCLMSSKIWHVVLTILNSFLRQSCLVSTNVTSALEVLLYDIVKLRTEAPGFWTPVCIRDPAFMRDSASIETCQSHSFLPPMLYSIRQLKVNHIRLTCLSASEKNNLCLLMRECLTTIILQCISIVSKTWFHWLVFGTRLVSWTRLETETGFYQHKLHWPPACIWDPAFMWDLASSTRVLRYALYIHVLLTYLLAYKHKNGNAGISSN